MIGQIRGEVVSIRETDRGCEAVIDVSGIGYRLAVRPGDLEKLGSADGSVTVFTHLHVREDDLSLYAFSRSDERDLFETLLGASGIGPKVALAILSVHSPRALSRAVASGDLGALTMVPGIGPKSAQKLLLELRDKLDSPLLESVPDSGAAPLTDVSAALSGLGYDQSEIRGALSGFDPENHSDSEAMLREALKRLAQKAREV